LIGRCWHRPINRHLTTNLLVVNEKNLF
jgi:hypothetical protein